MTVLSASGTAAVINLQYAADLTASLNNKELLLTSSVEETVQLLEENTGKILITSESDEKSNGDDGLDMSGNVAHANAPNPCNLCHIPYSRNSVHVDGSNANIGKCCICKLVPILGFEKSCVFYLKILVSDGDLFQMSY